MSRGRLWTEEQFNCPVCLDLPTDPVTIPCGHSYCMYCIADYWDSEHKKRGTCSCPECRQNFDPRPPLCRNTMLAEAVEQLRLGNLSSAARESIRSARRAAASASERGARNPQATQKKPGTSVSCDRCQDMREAVKTCLVCMASFCESHVKPHQTQDKFKSHELIAPTGDLTQKICPEHKYLHEFYCRTCQLYVCWLCTSNKHKDHESVSTQVERTEKQKTIAAVQTENQQRLQERERELKDMKKVLDTLMKESDEVNEESEVVLDELQRSVQRLADLIQQVMSSSGQEKISEVQQVVDKLETEVSQMKKKEVELKKLVTCQDNIHYLKTYQNLCSPELSEMGSVTANLDASFIPVRNIVLDLREKVENMCNQELDKINKTVFNMSAFTVPTPQSNQKSGILKLFSGLGGKTANSRTQGPPSLPSVSVRGPAPVTRNQDLKSPNQSQADRPRANHSRERADMSSSSLGPRERQRRNERLTESERQNQNSTRSSTGRNRNTGDDQEDDTVSVHSLQPQSSQRRAYRDQDTWSLSSSRSRDSRLGDDGPTAGTAANRDERSSVREQQPPTRHQPERQSDRWSLSSLLPRNRKKRQESVNPGLFLDSPSADSIRPAFPSLKEINIESIQAPEPRSRDEFLQYACDLTFDPKTAHRRLVLSEHDTKAALQASAQPYPDTPERFDGWTQIFSLEPLSFTRCYWEVEWRGRGSSVGIACASMPREGSDARAGLGYNDQSWSLELSDICYAALHGNQKQEIPMTYCPRVGVYLDREAETLTFYGVDDMLVHLYTFSDVSFRQPLFAAFGVGSGVGVGLDFALGNFSSTTDSIKICAI
ncbi:E3 ubiquitin/ISG15 ligase TRIM25 [Trichomycterus rosablanca]|uniref:E3 ubiquitin/ISG15 ligase TRIM25 n=1 Tax=Trichomycterus rosablanca TaxID=2290929 RepID=UPI002F35D931